jgi:chromosomal replication initiator protein
MTSDRPPRELKGLQDRLLSRFKWGLTADLQQPDFETRLAIIQRKLQNEGISLDAEVIEYLANTIDSNIRELEGVIVSLMAHSSLNRRPIDMVLAKEVVQRVVQKQDELPHEDIEVGIDTIMEEVARYFGLSVEALKSKSRKKEIVVPRQIAMYLCKEYTNFSLKSIGYHFGGRDHSTVIHAVQNISELREKDADFRLYIDQLLDRLRMLKQS